MNQFCGPFFGPGATLFGLFVFIAILLWIALPFLVFSLWLRAKTAQQTLDQILTLLRKHAQLLEQINSSAKGTPAEDSSTPNDSPT